MKLALFIGQPVFYDDTHGYTINYIGLIDWLLSLVDKVELIDIYLPVYHGGGSIKLNLSSSMTIISLYRPWHLKPFGKLYRLRHLIRILNLLRSSFFDIKKYDAVGMTPPFSPFSLFINIFCSKPAFFICRGDILKTNRYHYPRNSPKKLMALSVVGFFDFTMRLMVRRKSVIMFTVGKYIAKKYIKVAPNSVFNIEPLISSNIIQEKEIANEVTDILYVGRLAWEKGVEDILYSFKLLLEAEQEIGNITLHLAGTGPEEKRLKSIAQELNITNWVRFRGFVPPDERLWNLYDSCQIFVNSAYTGAGRTVYEAMARGIPVITTRRGVARLLDAKNCITVVPGDWVQLKDAMLRLIKDKELRMCLAKQGYRTASMVTFERQARGMIRHIKEILVPGRSQ